MLARPILPTLTLNQFLDFRDALRRQRVSAKISFERCFGGSGKLFLGRARPRHVLLEKLVEGFEHVHGAARRIVRLHRQPRSLAVGFEFLIFAVARFENFDGQRYQRAERYPLESFLRLYSLGAMEMINVFDLVAQDPGELIFVVHEVHQAGADEHVSARQGECVYEVGA